MFDNIQIKRLKAENKRLREAIREYERKTKSYDRLQAEVEKLRDTYTKGIEKVNVALAEYDLLISDVRKLRNELINGLKKK